MKNFKLAFLIYLIIALTLNLCLTFSTKNKIKNRNLKNLNVSLYLINKYKNKTAPTEASSAPAAPSSASANKSSDKLFENESLQFPEHKKTPNNTGLSKEDLVVANTFII